MACAIPPGGSGRGNMYNGSGFRGNGNVFGAVGSRSYTVTYSAIANGHGLTRNTSPNCTSLPELIDFFVRHTGRNKDRVVNMMMAFMWERDEKKVQELAKSLNNISIFESGGLYGRNGLYSNLFHNNGSCIDFFGNGGSQGAFVGVPEGLCELLEQRFTACEECGVQKASYICMNCNRCLCETCVPKHLQRSTYCRGHNILPLSPSHSPRQSHRQECEKEKKLICVNHRLADAVACCIDCRVPLCRPCMGIHMKHKVATVDEYAHQCRNVHAMQVLENITYGEKYLTDLIIQGTATKVNINRFHAETTENIKKSVDAIKAYVERIGQELILEAENIRKCKIENLDAQLEEFRSVQQTLQNCLILVTEGKNSLSSIHTINMIEFCFMAVNKLKRKYDNQSLHESHHVEFRACFKTIVNILERCLKVHSSPSYLTTCVTGKRKYFAHAGKKVRLNFTLRDHNGRPVLKELSENELKFSVEAFNVTSGYRIVLTKIPETVHDVETYRIEYTAPPEGVTQIKWVVKLRGQEVVDSGFVTKIIQSRNYSTIGIPKMIIGKEGSENGEFCRPWGVCCDEKGHIFVADRSNNRIQVFNPDFSFSHAFGSYGDGPGELNRPCGIAWDSFNQCLVVVDKDNHRIGIYRFNGSLVRNFGCCKGVKVGDTNYPWDCAVSDDGLIAVSDSRNHRVQQFTHEGEVVNKIGIENPSSLTRIFDSPRGVAYMTDRRLVVTDFNLHKVAIVSRNFCEYKFMGSEGQRESIKPNDLRFFRPSGVDTDDDNNLVVADSKNNRIVILSQTGTVLYTFGEFGNTAGCCDRPSGICITPEGDIVFVDFGNNRLCVY